ncbi:VOC family protein [Piscinibacter sakaiensis]|uniref:VOC family protein n=1 Tax=Piscinibacter sakaiensis TaxID=1547922 RepID=UPI003729A2B2
MAASPFVWYELMTSDPAAAAAFYTGVVGWQAADSGMPGVDYTVLSAGPSMIAGLMALPEHLVAEGVPPHWIGYVGVDDVDAKTAELQRLGGQLHKAPEDIPGVGRFAVRTAPRSACSAASRPRARRRRSRRRPARPARWAGTS